MAAKLPHSDGVSISHPDKMYFSDAGITKGELIEYYDRISEMMLPYMKDRPLAMHRFPDGIDGTIRHVLCNTKEILLYLANQGALLPMCG